MDITPLISDGYTGPIKRLTCSICKHTFYITQDDYHRHPEIRFCHECSLILREELEKTQGARSLTPPPVREKPVASAPLPSSVASIQPIPLPQPRTIDREKMTVEQLLEEAKMLRKTWRYKEALRSYDEALQRDPHCIEILYKRAEMLETLDRPHEALLVYEEILHLEPASAKAYGSKGGPLIRLSRYEEALAACDAALQLDPSCQQASTGKWLIFTRLHREEEAERFRRPKTKSAKYQEDVTQPCQTAEDYYKRGHALSLLDRNEEAIRAYEACLHLDPLRLDVYEHLHIMHYKKEMCGQLVAVFDRAVQAFPTCTKLHIYRAEVLRRLERYQDALEASNRAIESDRMDPAAYHEKSENLHRLKRDTEALEAIEQAIALEPDSEYFYRQKAEILASLRHYDEALTAYDQAIHLDPDSDYSYWVKARFLKQIGRDEDVLATHDQFIERFPTIFKGYQEKLFFLSERKRYEDGLKTCDAYLQHHPHHRLKRMSGKAACCLAWTAQKRLCSVTRRRFAYSHRTRISIRQRQNSW
jgi:tetratricopeptide (TPR) repeat protein